MSHNDQHCIVPWWHDLQNRHERALKKSANITVSKFEVISNFYIDKDTALSRITLQIACLKQFRNFTSISQTHGNSGTAACLCTNELIKAPANLMMKLLQNHIMV